MSSPMSEDKNVTFQQEASLMKSTFVTNDQTEDVTLQSEPLEKFTKDMHVSIVANDNKTVMESSEEEEEEEDSRDDSSGVVSSCESEDSGYNKNQEIRNKDVRSVILPGDGELVIAINSDDLQLDSNVELKQIGSILHLMEDGIVVIKATIEGPNILNLESDLFIQNGKSIGKVRDVIGAVRSPSYIVVAGDIIFNELKVGMPIFCVPNDKSHTSYVIQEKLKKAKAKATDASWVGDEEIPDHLQDYSDDEEEKRQRRKKKNRREENVESNKEEKSQNKIQKTNKTNKSVTNSNKSVTNSNKSVTNSNKSVKHQQQCNSGLSQTGPSFNPMNHQWGMQWGQSSRHPWGPNSMQGQRPPVFGHGFQMYCQGPPMHGQRPQVHDQGPPLMYDQRPVHGQRQPPMHGRGPSPMYGQGQLMNGQPPQMHSQGQHMYGRGQQINGQGQQMHSQGSSSNMYPGNQYY